MQKITQQRHSATMMYAGPSAVAVLMLLAPACFAANTGTALDAWAPAVAPQMLPWATTSTAPLPVKPKGKPRPRRIAQESATNEDTSPDIKQPLTAGNDSAEPASVITTVTDVQLSDSHVDDLFSAKGNKWLGDTLRQSGCRDAKIYLRDMEYGYQYKFHLKVTAKNTDIGLSNVIPIFSERADLNGSPEVPKFVWSNVLTEQKHVITKDSSVVAVYSDTMYPVRFTPDAENYNDAHADLVIAYKLKFYENHGSNWDGPYERVDSCVLYRIIGPALKPDEREQSIIEVYQPVFK